MLVSRFDVSSIPVCITLQRFSQILKKKKLIWNLHYTDEDQKSDTIIHSYQLMEKILISLEKKKLQYIYNTMSGINPACSQKVQRMCIEKKIL